MFARHHPISRRPPAPPAFACCFRAGRMRNGEQVGGPHRIDDAGFARRHDHHLPRARGLRDLAAAFRARSEDRAGEAPLQSLFPPRCSGPAPRPTGAGRQRGAPAGRREWRRRGRGRTRAGSLEGCRRSRLARRGRARRDPPPRACLRRPRVHRGRQDGLRDDRHSLRARRPQGAEEPPRARGLRGLRAGDRRSREEGREGRNHLRLDRQGRHRECRGEEPRRPDHGALRLEAHHRDPRRSGQRDRRQPRGSGRRDRRVDLRAHARRPRPQLAARRNRNRAVSGAPQLLRSVVLSFGLFFSLSAAAEGPRSIGDARLTLLSFSDLAGWAVDNHEAALAAFRRSCRPRCVQEAPPLRTALPASDDLKRSCGAALDPARSGTARMFFEDFFTPFEVTPPSGRGSLTGYFEPEYEGSLVKTESFPTPLLARPDDLVTVPQGENWPGLEALQAARTTETGYEPFPDRAAIEDGALGERAKSVVFLGDPVDAFIIQVQGSARIRLADGRTIRIAYAGKNGYPFTAPGRIIVERGHVPLAEMNLERLTSWLRANPGEGREIMRSEE